MPTLTVTDPKFTIFMTGCPKHDAGDTGLYNWAATLYNMAINAPTLTAIAPSTVVHGAPDTKVTCTGTNFVRGAIAKAGTNALASGVPNATTLNTTIPAALLASAGTLSITVTLPDNQVTAAQTFTIS